MMEELHRELAKLSEKFFSKVGYCVAMVSAISLSFFSGTHACCVFSFYVRNTLPFLENIQFSILPNVLNRSRLKFMLAQCIYYGL